MTITRADVELMTTGDLVSLLREQDPSGLLILEFQVTDEMGGGIVAFGEVEGIETSIKHAYQTDAGDRDVLRLRFPLFCP